MLKKIIISRINNIAAIIQNNKIQELIVINEDYQVNDIYTGIVQKILTSINAAFIKLDKREKCGFIHISDIQLSRQLFNINKMAQSIAVKQILLVQVIKEPTKYKGPRLTTNIHITGQYIILMPFHDTICIANKIYDDNERSYLKSFGVLIKPTQMGLLFKESSKGITDYALIQDLRQLKKQWHFIQKSAIYKTCPSLLYKDNDIVQKIIRDFYDKHIKSIIIDSENGFKQLHYYLNKYTKIRSLELPSIQLYKNQGCILEEFDINNTIFHALKPKVHLTNGAYIVIENSEALTIIDVNSGSFNHSSDTNSTILKTNCLAATEIAYQLKIRNINGVIIVDFIDMKTRKDQLQLLEHFTKVLKIDHSRPQIIQLSELGLVELTRRRRGKSLLELFENSKNRNYTNYSNKSSIYTRKCNSSYSNTLNVNINSIFFKKIFNNIIELSSFTYNNTNSFTIIPISIINTYILPIQLYGITV